ncbi:DUF7529 family protein [Halomicrococcus sp. NG-SE-24]|uniref:DUF7529 family protein n=1 Tax=Halomicrococcus sp. NG-SE-24 TaxID=3436928 RepID=UPI003D95DB69
MSGDAPNYTANTRAMEFWDEVVEDMEATAAEYEDAGWDALLLHPGDVTPVVYTDDEGADEGVDVELDAADVEVVPDEDAGEVESTDAAGDSVDVSNVTEYGLDVLVPDDEFGELESLLEDGVAFDSFEAFRAAEDRMVYLVVAMEDHDAETAVLYPAYYDVQGAAEMLEAADERGTMYTFVRTLSDDRIQFTHEDQSVFQPPAPETETSEDADDGTGE